MLESKIRRNYIKALVLLIVGCGGVNEAVDKSTEKPGICVDVYVNCEFVVYHTSDNRLVAYARVQDCAYDLGICMQHNPDCVQSCKITLVPSYCEDQCLEY